MNESTQRKTGAILSYVSIIVNTIIQLIYTSFLIRMLGQSEYGMYSIINSIIGSLAVLDLGFGNAIIVYTAKYRAKNDTKAEEKLHGMFQRVFLIISVVAILLGVILYFLVEPIFGQTMTFFEIEKMKIMMLILTFNLGVTFAFSIYSSIIIAYERFAFQKIVSIVGTLLKPLLMIPLLFLGFKSITMCIVISVANVLVILSNYYYCRKKLNKKIKYKGFDKAVFKTIIGYSIWIFIATIVDKINWSVDHFVLGAVSGTVAVSIYSVAGQLNNLFISLSSAISGVLLPKVSKMVATNQSDKKLSEEFTKVGRIQYLIILLMASGLVLVGKEFFNVWVGTEYADSYYIALLLIIPVCIPLIQNLGISIMQAKNMHRFRSILYAVIAVANIGISIPLSIRFGGIGAAIGTALSLIIGNGIIINIYYYKKVKLDVISFWKEIIKMTIPQSISIIIVIILMNLIKIHGIPYLLFFGGIYTILYCLVCYFITMNEYEKQIINKVLKKLHLIRG